MAFDLKDALDNLADAQREYEFQRKGYRESDAAIGDPEWTRYHDASLARNDAFREAVRHALGMAR